MSKTIDDLKEAFAGESQANRKYLAFAKQAERQGYPNIATYAGVQESLVAVRTGRAAAIFTSPIVGNLAIRDQGFDLKPIWANQDGLYLLTLREDVEHPFPPEIDHMPVSRARLGEP